MSQRWNRILVAVALAVVLAVVLAPSPAVASAWSLVGWDETAVPGEPTSLAEILAGWWHRLAAVWQTDDAGTTPPRPDRQEATCAPGAACASTDGGANADPNG